MWKLAGFLYWAGEEWPWLWLQNASQSHGQPLDSATMVDTIVNLMLKRGYTVCLDDFQQVEADPLAQAFGRRLAAASQADALSLVVTARSLPGFLQGVDFEPLGGMSLQEARQLFMERKMPPLGGDLLERLHKLTEGNPQLLELAIVAIRQGADPQRLANALTERQAVEEYLFDQVDSLLDKLDRQVMIAVALLGPGGDAQGDRGCAPKSECVPLPRAPGPAATAAIGAAGNGADLSPARHGASLLSPSDLSPGTSAAPSRGRRVLRTRGQGLVIRGLAFPRGEGGQQGGSPGVVGRVAVHQPGPRPPTGAGAGPSSRQTVSIAWSGRPSA